MNGKSGAMIQRSRPTSPKPSPSSVTAFHSYEVSHPVDSLRSLKVFGVCAVIWRDGSPETTQRVLHKCDECEQNPAVGDGQDSGDARTVSARLRGCLLIRPYPLRR